MIIKIISSTGNIITKVDEEKFLKRVVKWEKQGEIGYFRRGDGQILKFIILEKEEKEEKKEEEEKKNIKIENKGEKIEVQSNPIEVFKSLSEKERKEFIQEADKETLILIYDYLKSSRIKKKNEYIQLIESLLSEI